MMPFNYSELLQPTNLLREFCVPDVYRPAGLYAQTLEVDSALKNWITSYKISVKNRGPITMDQMVSVWMDDVITV